MARLRRAAALVLAGVASVPASAQQAPTAVLVLDGVTVVDVEQGKLAPGQRVVIAGNRIRAAGRASEVKLPAGARVVDARGKYLIPGLWDLHVHPNGGAPGFFYPLSIANGVTGIRDAASRVPLDTLIRWRREILAGTRVGPPRQILSGKSIDMPPAPFCQSNAHICVATAAEARHLVDSFKTAGADMLKLYLLSSEMYFILAAEARRAGIPFGGHISTPSPQVIPVTAAEATDSGAVIIDHMGFKSAGEVDSLCGGSSASVEGCGSLVERFRRNGTWVVATLNSYPNKHGQTSKRIVERFRNDVIAKFWAGSMPSGNWLYDSAGGPTVKSLGYLDVARRVGLPILAGTDAASGHKDALKRKLAGFALHVELAVLVAEGLSPLEALQAATLNPAKLLHATDSLGTVATGKLADLVLLDANPLEDITHTTTIRAVVANGRYFDRAALDSVLADGRAKGREIIAAP